jgi:transcriptional regulator with XRE-family HTH domain
VQRLADLIRGYRVAAEFTQEQLARRAGVSASTLLDLEQGRTSRCSGG